MGKIKLPVSFRDWRGVIVDLLQGEAINAATMITFKKGAVRGNHYHRKTTQWNYVLSGEIEFFTQLPGKKTVRLRAKKGGFVVTVPNERHALRARADSELMVLTKGPRGGKEYETDTIRLADPLVARSKRP